MNIGEKAIGIITMIIAVAIIAVIVGTRSQSANVITAAANALAKILGVVVAPASGNAPAPTNTQGTPNGQGAGTPYSQMFQQQLELLNSGNAGQSLSAYIGTLSNGGQFQQPLEFDPPPSNEADQIEV